MARTQLIFENSKDGPIYVSVEPWPMCFELDPGEKLTLVWDASESGNSAHIAFVNERELTIWPEGNIDDIQCLIDGVDAENRNWKFKHQ